MSQSREVLLVGSRFNVERRSVTRRDGTLTTREIVVHPGSVVILPLLEDGKIVLIQNRRAVLGRTLFELPAGTREPSEEPRLCAARELEEETGYRADTLTPLMDFYPAPGISDERMYAFLAEGLVKTAQDLDETEDIVVHEVSEEQAVSMIMAGQIEDAKTIATVLFYREKKRALSPTAAKG